jgi:hypothetical protein
VEFCFARFLPGLALFHRSVVPSLKPEFQTMAGSVPLAAIIFIRRIFQEGIK